jgi:hypothetical protein
VYVAAAPLVEYFNVSCVANELLTLPRDCIVKPNRTAVPSGSR